MKRIVAAMALGLAACQAAPLADVPETVEVATHPASPAVLAAFGEQSAITSVEQWTDERVPALRKVNVRAAATD